MEIVNKLNKLLALPLLGLLWIYQRTLSPDHGLSKVFYPHGFCKFYPSCSMYVRAVLRQEGLLGLPKIIRRLLVCNPWTLGGVDLP